MALLILASLQAQGAPRPSKASPELPCAGTTPTLTPLLEAPSESADALLALRVDPDGGARVLTPRGVLPIEVNRAGAPRVGAPLADGPEPQRWEPSPSRLLVLAPEDQLLDAHVNRCALTLTNLNARGAQLGTPSTVALVSPSRCARLTLTELDVEEGGLIRGAARWWARDDASGEGRALRFHLDSTGDDLALSTEEGGAPDARCMPAGGLPTGAQTALRCDPQGGTGGWILDAPEPGTARLSRLRPRAVPDRPEPPVEALRWALDPSSTRGLWTLEPTPSGDLYAATGSALSFISTRDLTLAARMAYSVPASAVHVQGYSRRCRSGERATLQPSISPEGVAWGPRAGGQCRDALLGLDLQGTTTWFDVDGRAVPAPTEGTQTCALQDGCLSARDPDGFRALASRFGTAGEALAIDEAWPVGSGGDFGYWVQRAGCWAPSATLPAPRVSRGWLNLAFARRIAVGTPSPGAALLLGSRLKGVVEVSPFGESNRRRRFEEKGGWVVLPEMETPATGALWNEDAEGHRSAPVSWILAGELVRRSLYLVAGGVLALVSFATFQTLRAHHFSRQNRLLRSTRQFHPSGEPILDPKWMVNGTVRADVKGALEVEGGRAIWWGPPRSGKTSILDQVGFDLREQGLRVAALAALPGDATGDRLKRRLYREVALAYGPAWWLAVLNQWLLRRPAGHRNLASTIDACQTLLTRMGRAQPLVILVDEAQYLYGDYPRLEDGNPHVQLRAWLRDQLQSARHDIRVGLTGHDLPHYHTWDAESAGGSTLLNIFSRGNIFMLRDWGTPEEIRALVQRGGALRDLHYSGAALERFLEHAMDVGYHLMTVQGFAVAVARTAQEGARGRSPVEVTPETVDQALARREVLPSRACPACRSAQTSWHLRCAACREAWRPVTAASPPEGEALRCPHCDAAHPCWELACDACGASAPLVFLVPHGTERSRPSA